MQAVARNCRNQSLRCEGRKPKWPKPRGESTEAEHWDGPIRMSNSKLQNACQRDSKQAPHHIQVQTNLVSKNADAPGATEQAIELVRNSNATASKRRPCGARDAQTRKRSKAENETRVEEQIDDVRDPKQAHGNGSVAGATKNRVVKKQHQHHAAAAQTNAGVTAADGYDLR